MKRSTLTLLALAVPALVSLALPGDELRFAPADGVSISKTFKTTVDLSLDEMRIVMNGEEQDAGMLEMEMSMSNTSDFAWTDTYAGVESGRPTRLSRTFETLGNITATSQSNQYTGSMDFELESSSELTDKTVIFTWDAEEEGFIASFPEDEDADVELLESLDEDTDLRGFLPEAAVSTGDTWSIDASYLINLMGPGGNLKLVPDDSDLPEGAGPSPGSELSFSEMLGEIEGDVDCEYKGMREVDGHSFAAITISVDVTSANDLTEMIKQKMDEIDMSDQGVEMDFQSADVELAVEGEGTLLWNIAEGHFASFEFDGDMSQTMDMAMTVGTPMGDMDMEQTIEMSGSISFEFEASEE